jgi:hypothetical protein
VRDDRKGAPARNLVGQGTHQATSAVARSGSSAGRPGHTGYDGCPRVRQPPNSPLTATRRGEADR